MNDSEISGLCEHIRAERYPFSVDLVMDDHLGLTDGVVHCRHCQRAYLLEMLDWADNERVYRISPVDAAHAHRLIGDLQRGSCDLQRAGAEVQHLKTANAFAPWLILVDMREPRIDCMASLLADEESSAPSLPGASWRELPCDGSWVKYTRAHQSPPARRSSTAIENG